MKYCIPFLLFLPILNGMAQNQSRPVGQYFSYELSALKTESPVKKWKSIFTPDHQQTFRPKSPLMTSLVGSSTKEGNYWMGSMTTQSYNQGKLGTYYLWDVQGNLRESRMFLDIAGKNKRGLKLVFRRR